jgi:hypothetical protein
MLESDDYEFIKNKEVEFIKLYGRKDLNKGTLVNLTDSGEGSSGRKITNEEKLAQSIRQKGKVKNKCRVLNSINQRICHYRFKPFISFCKNVSM